VSEREALARTLAVYDNRMEAQTFGDWSAALPVLVEAARRQLAFTPETCERCNGAGWAGDDTHLVERTEDPCSVCHGRGTVYPVETTEPIAIVIAHGMVTRKSPREIAVAVLDALNDWKPE